MGKPPDLRTDARKNVPEDVWDCLSERETDVRLSLTASEQIDQLISRIKQKQDELQKNRTSYFDNIIGWLHKFKDTHDAVSLSDPVHVAPPWAAFRFVLKCVVAGQEHAESILKLLLSTPRSLVSGRILNAFYTQESDPIGETRDRLDIKQKCLDKLHKELTNLYSRSLGVLHSCYSILSKDEVRQKLAAVFNLSKSVDILSELEAQHKQVIKDGEASDRVLNHRILDKSCRTLGELTNQDSQVLVQTDKIETADNGIEMSSFMQREQPQGLSWASLSSDLQQKTKTEHNMRSQGMSHCAALQIQQMFSARSLGRERVTISLKPNADGSELNHLLQLAAKTKTTNLIHLLKSIDTDVDSQQEGKGPLMVAIQRQDVLAASMLFGSGSSVNSICAILPKTTLSAEVFRGDITSWSDVEGMSRRMLMHFLKAGACHNQNGGKPTLVFMIMNLNALNIGRLIPTGVGVNQVPLQSYLAVLLEAASERGSTKRVWTLLDSELARVLNGKVELRSALISTASNGQLCTCNVLLDLEKLDINQVQNGRFLNSLFPVVISCRGYSAGRHRFRKPLTNLEGRFKGSRNHRSWGVLKRFSGPADRVKHLQVLQTTSERGLNIAMPIYSSLDSINPFSPINSAGYEITNVRLFSPRGHHGRLPYSWFSIMRELQTRPEPQASFRSQLQRWNFPGTLPPRLTIIAKLMSVSRDLPNCFLVIYIQHNLSQLILVPAQLTDQTPSNPQTEHGRWKHCIPRNIDVANVIHYPGSLAKVGRFASTTMVAFDKLICPQYGMTFPWFLTSFVVGLLAWFMAFFI